MWHEVRKQERKIRCMIVDYKRRAERRKDFYEKIKADPTQFLQLHGRPVKIHLDPATAIAGASSSNLMSWQGSPNVVIDRFDVRAHLDYIPDHPKGEDTDVSYEERNINYERYRILVQNDFLGVGEDKFLRQLHLEEQYGATKSVDSHSDKKKTGAAIGFNYDDPSAPAQASYSNENNGDDEENEEDSDIDFDFCVDVKKISIQQGHELNNAAQPYGMEGNDFFSFLTKDREDAINLRIAKELEEEKAMYSGRKSRRERRAYREKKLAGRVISPPSYASRKSPTYRDYNDSHSSSKSHSPSPINSGKITYITSFGGEEANPSSSPKLKATPRTLYNEIARTVSQNKSSYKYKYNSRSRSRSRSRKRSRSRSSSRIRSRYKSDIKRKYRHHKRSRSWSRSRSRTRSSSRSKRSSSSNSSSRSPVRHDKSSHSKFETSTKQPIKQPPAPIISRYYGRRGRSSSELSMSDEDSKPTRSFSSAHNRSDRRKSSLHSGNSSRNKTSSSSFSSGPKITPQERLKRKMQAQINKHYKADKRAEREKKEKVEQERIDREDEMREISIKLRKRERLRRHEYLAECDRHRSSSSSHSRSTSRSRSLSQSPRRPTRRKRSQSRSRSRSRHSRSSSRESNKYKNENRALVDY